MVREYKFRGKRIDNGDWEFGDLSQWNEDDGRHRTFISFEGLEPIEVHPDSVGQYTGLKDKNEKEIYDGDIIRSLDSHGNEILHRVSYHTNEASFVGYYGNFSYCRIPQEWIDTYDKEVIGNIHDNPELLKGGKE